MSIESILQRFAVIKSTPFGTPHEDIRNLVKEICSRPVPRDVEPDLIRYSPLIANRFAATPERSTDGLLSQVLPADVFKTMLLYSHRNSMKLDIGRFFDYDPLVASWWWALAVNNGLSTSAAADETLKHIWNHPAVPERYALTRANSRGAHEMVFPFFLCSYSRSANEREVKSLINRRLRVDDLVNMAGRDLRRIAVISGHLFKGHAVQRSIGPCLSSLRGDYDLTGINLTPSRPMDAELFDRTYDLNGGAGWGGVARIVTENRCGIVIHPDVGMSQASIMLSQGRMAPIQIAMYGHPVSTFNPTIDYFVGGREVEQPDAQALYSERLLLTDGLGCVPTRPEYVPTPTSTGDTITVGCNWSNHKFDYRHLTAIRDAIGSVPCKLMFISVTDRNNELQALVSDVAGLFAGTKVRLHFVQEGAFRGYMDHENQCDFLIDSYPFGGFNRVVDALACGKPVVAMAGDKAANRLAGAVLRRVGLSELVAADQHEMRAIVTRLFDANYLRQIKGRVVAADLDAKLFQTNDADGFRQVIEQAISRIGSWPDKPTPS